MMPRQVRVVSDRRARCTVCGAVLTAWKPWQLLDVARRHVAESHPTADAAPPQQASAASPLTAPSATTG